MPLHLNAPKEVQEICSSAYRAEEGLIQLSKQKKFEPFAGSIKVLDIYDSLNNASQGFIALGRRAFPEPLEKEEEEEEEEEKTKKKRGPLTKLEDDIKSMEASFLDIEKRSGLTPEDRIPQYIRFSRRVLNLMYAVLKDTSSEWLKRLEDPDPQLAFYEALITILHALDTASYYLLRINPLMGYDTFLFYLEKIEGTYTNMTTGYDTFAIQNIRKEVKTTFPHLDKILEITKARLMDSNYFPKKPVGLPTPTNAIDLQIFSANGRLTGLQFATVEVNLQQAISLSNHLNKSAKPGDISFLFGASDEQMNQFIIILSDSIYKHSGMVASPSVIRKKDIHIDTTQPAEIIPDTPEDKEELDKDGPGD